MRIAFHLDQLSKLETAGIYRADNSIFRIIINERGDSVSFDDRGATVTYATNLHMKPAHIAYDKLPDTIDAVRSKAENLAVSLATGKLAGDYLILCRALEVAECAGLLSIEIA